jgi:glycolate oxidase iron-sulfur subunit
MKAYGHLLRDDPAWRERAERFAARVVDLSEQLAPQAERLALRLEPGALPGPVAYDDPCHLCHGQGVRAQPRILLDRVEGLERVELPESEGCCGSAGIYSVLRPADSQAVFARKLETLAECGAKVLVTANPGCQLQWESGLARAGSDVEVLHLAELLARALPAAREDARLGRA